MWSASCDSASFAVGEKAPRRPGSYSREYFFSLAQRSNVMIDLTSDTDAYLYLEGAGSRNRLNLEDDDGAREPTPE